MLYGPIPTSFSISSADYFNAKWRIPFDQKKTISKPFNNENGKTTNVSTMTNSCLVSIFVDNELSLVQLYYGNKAFRFSIILPGTFKNSNGYTLSDAIASLTPEQWQNMNNNTEEMYCDIFMPKFELDSKKNIASLMKKLGLNSLFEAGSMKNIIQNNPELSIGAVLQAVKINVTENGTKAASVTTALNPGSNWNPNEPIHVNRPFAFIIDETSTGAILYAGVVRSL